MANPKPLITWFEIPANDLDRAVDFYSRVLKIKLERVDKSMAFFSHGNATTGGALVQARKNKPGKDGALLYFAIGKSKDLTNALKRVVSAGGKVHVPKTVINKEHGSFAHIIDTEGNKVALHAMPS